MSYEKSVEIISLIESSDKINSLLHNYAEPYSVNDNSEEIKLFFVNCLGENSSSMFDKLTYLNSQENYSTKANFMILKKYFVNTFR